MTYAELERALAIAVALEGWDEAARLCEEMIRICPVLEHMPVLGERRREYLRRAKRQKWTWLRWAV